MSDFLDSPTMAIDQNVDAATLLQELLVVVERAKSMPLSASVIVPRDELLDLVHQIVDSFPTELAEARRILKDQEGVLERTRRDAAQLLDEARAQAAHMVERTEVVRQARYKAERLIADAEADARRTRHDADDYVDRKLAAFEIVLDRTMRTVSSGRERLAVPAQAEPEVALGEAGEDGF